MAMVAYLVEDATCEQYVSIIFKTETAANDWIDAQENPEDFLIYEFSHKDFTFDEFVLWFSNECNSKQTH